MVAITAFVVAIHGASLAETVREQAVLGKQVTSNLRPCHAATIVPFGPEVANDRFHRPTGSLAPTIHYRSENQRPEPEFRPAAIHDGHGRPAEKRGMS